VAVAALGASLEQSGFAYIIGHGVPEAMIEELWHLSRAFHALPLEAKKRIVINEFHRGYMPLAASTLLSSTVAEVRRPNQSESLMIMHEVDDQDPRFGQPLQGPNQWPEELPQMREASLSYMQRMSGLGRRIAGGLAEALGLPRDWFSPFFTRPTLFLRMLHYPQQSDEAGLFGSAPHTDYGFITLLAQDNSGGLEVLNRQGEWIPVPPVPGSYVLNIGDILQRWSNGRFASTPHRVRNLKPRDRYSLPFFFDPMMDTLVATPEELACGGAAVAPEPIRYGDYLLERLNRNYGYRQAR
jgi:isopenicillin N synthase-like dioxygenase